MAAPNQRAVQDGRWFIGEIGIGIRRSEAVARGASKSSKRRQESVDARKARWIGGASRKSQRTHRVVVQHAGRGRVGIMKPLLPDSGVNQKGGCNGLIVIQPGGGGRNVLIPESRDRHRQPVGIAVFMAGVVLNVKREF